MRVTQKVIEILGGWEGNRLDAKINLVLILPTDPLAQGVRSASEVNTPNEPRAAYKLIAADMNEMTSMLRCRMKGLPNQVG